VPQQAVERVVVADPRRKNGIQGPAILIQTCVVLAICESMLPIEAPGKPISTAC
jgi:hypothetical protein